jgi:hypothetical protein
MMRVVNRKTFLALPAGTIYTKIGNETGDTSHYYFGEVRIKDDLRGDSDWYSVGFVDGFTTAHDSGEWADCMDLLYEGGEAELDFDTVGSDGLYDEGQLFAVFSDDEVRRLIERLQQARKRAQTPSSDMGKGE